MAKTDKKKHVHMQQAKSSLCLDSGCLLELCTEKRGKRLTCNRYYVVIRAYKKDLSSVQRKMNVGRYMVNLIQCLLDCT